MIIQDFEIASTVGDVINIVHSFRVRRQKVQRKMLLTERLCNPESGYERELIDYTVNPYVSIAVGDTDGGATIRIEMADSPIDGTVGDPVASSQYAQEIIQAILSKTRTTVNELIPDRLSDREKEVAHLLANYLNDREIAEILMLSQSTVVSHRKNIRVKWELRTQDIKAMQEKALRRGYGQGVKIP